MPIDYDHIFNAQRSQSSLLLCTASFKYHSIPITHANKCEQFTRLSTQCHTNKNVNCAGVRAVLSKYANTLRLGELSLEDVWMNTFSRVYAYINSTQNSTHSAHIRDHGMLACCARCSERFFLSQTSLHHSHKSAHTSEESVHFVLCVEFYVVDNKIWFSPWIRMRLFATDS